MKRVKRISPDVWRYFYLTQKAWERACKRYTLSLVDSGKTQNHYWLDIRKVGR